MRVLVAQTGGAARVLALLQQVPQLGAIQRPPTHTPVKVIDSLALDKTHTHTHADWKTRAEATVAVDFTAVGIFMLRAALSYKHEMQNELLFMAWLLASDMIIFIPQTIPLLFIITNDTVCMKCSATKP